MEALLALLIGSWLLLIVGLNALRRSRVLGASVIAAALAAIVAGSIVYETAGIAVWMLGAFAALEGAHQHGTGRRGIGTAAMVIGAAAVLTALALLRAV